MNKIQKRLKIHFGVSPQSMKLQQRISNRGIMEETHRLCLGEDIEVLAKKRTRRSLGDIKKIQRLIKNKLSKNEF